MRTGRPPLPEHRSFRIQGVELRLAGAGLEIRSAELTEDAGELPEQLVAVHDAARGFREGVPELLGALPGSLESAPHVGRATAQGEPFLGRRLFDQRLENTRVLSGTPGLPVPNPARRL